MAQQTLDFVIAQQVTGQAEVAKLINSVGALDAEMKKLRAATSGMSGGFDQAAKAIRGNTNVLDAQSKALRNSRQGMQMAGMQVNDFVTSVSTGASPTQAFNQQIGQLGYAMSMMGGRLGAVGSFLAGPWSIAVIGASMVLGPLIEGLFKAGDEAENAGKKTEEYTEISYAQKLASESLIGVTDELNRLSGRYTLTMKEQANAAITVANAKILETQKTLDLAIAEAALNEQRIKGLRLTQQIQGFGGGDGARAAAAGTGLLTGLTEMSLEDNKRNIEGLRNELGKAKDALNFIQTNGVKAANGVSQTGRASRDAAKESEKQVTVLEELKKRYEQLMPATTRANNDLTEWLDLLKKAASDPAASAFMRPLQGELDAITIKLDEAAGGMRGMFAIMAAGRDLPIPKIEVPKIPEMKLELVQTPAALQKIIDKNIELQQSYEAIGRSVADGFRGMITGAQSFGDAMRGVINAVIEELFRLFVVQQIVGMVSGALGGLFGGASPSGSGSGMGAGLSFGRAAVGGYPAPGKPVMVGERGPELFVPTSSGKIIPNHQMSGGGGGMVINVDARGATSPEMVRQQVQQGILEAAPSIVAAAEQRTISTLRRPRLAGVL